MKEKLSDAIFLKMVGLLNRKIILADNSFIIVQKPLFKTFLEEISFYIKIIVILQQLFFILIEGMPDERRNGWQLPEGRDFYHKT